MDVIGIALVTFIACFFVWPLILFVAQVLGLYAIVPEGRCLVFMLFGKVKAQFDEPGFYFLPLYLPMTFLLVRTLGKCFTVDLRLDQQYLRSLPVNSEEGAPMGVGIWYEMFVNDPVSYLFKNTDPQGSLQANISSSVVRSLSNLPLSRMMGDRHEMSQTVRSEVTAKSSDWGYGLGSVYVRKVHFKDTRMIKQIEEKVVNRLRQVTSAIKQDGQNQVSVIRSAAEKQAAAEFAKAAAIRPQIVGAALQQISADPEVSNALFAVLEYQKLAEGSAKLTLIPEKQEPLSQLISAEEAGGSSGGGASYIPPDPSQAAAPRKGR